MRDGIGIIYLWLKRRAKKMLILKFQPSENANRLNHTNSLIGVFANKHNISMAYNMPVNTALICGISKNK